MDSAASSYVGALIFGAASKKENTAELNWKVNNSNNFNLPTSYLMTTFTE